MLAYVFGSTTAIFFSPLCKKVVFFLLSALYKNELNRTQIFFLEVLIYMHQVYLYRISVNGQIKDLQFYFNLHRLWCLI